VNGDSPRTLLRSLPIRSLWKRFNALIEPREELEDIGDRRRARVLSGVLLGTVLLGLVTMLVQLMAVPGFAPTFAVNTVALLALLVLGLYARTRHFRQIAAISMVVIILTCASAGLTNPDDPVWWAYTQIAVLLSSLLLPVRSALWVALVALLATLGVEVVQGFTVEQSVPRLMFQVVYAPLLMLVAHHRDGIESDRQRQAEHHSKLLEEAQRVARLGHWQWSPQTGIVTCSSELQKLLELATRTVPLAGFVDRFQPVSVNTLLRKTIESLPEHVAELELEHRRQDGSVRFVTLSIETVEHGVEPARVVGTVQDVTERRLAEQERQLLEQQRQASHRLETVGRIAGGIAHDFNNLLAVVLASSELAQRTQNDPARQRLYLNELKDAAEHGSSLVQQLLAYARKQVLETTALHLEDVVEALKPILERLVGRVRLSIERTGTSPILADRSQLEQVLLNLVVNAMEAIDCSVRRDKGTITIRTHQRDGQVVLEIADDGCGMDEGTQAQLFEPFFTTRSRTGGTGLGLATVHGIVYQTGGHIDVESTPGEGSTFRLFFPLYQGATEPAAPQQRPRLPRHSHILVVDDEPAVLHSTARMLEHAGFQVTPARSPAEAQRLWHGDEESIDMVLTDVIMPGTSGVELAHSFLSQRPGVRVVLMSGFSADIIAQHGFEQHQLPLLQKPFTSEALLQKLG